MAAKPPDLESPGGLTTTLLRLLGFGAVLAAALNAGLAFHDAWRLKGRVDQSERELASLKDRNDQLRRQIKALASDPASQEQMRRIHHHLRDGEELLRPR